VVGSAYKNESLSLMIISQIYLYENDNLGLFFYPVLPIKELKKIFLKDNGKMIFVGENDERHSA